MQTTSNRKGQHCATFVRCDDIPQMVKNRHDRPIHILIYSSIHMFIHPSIHPSIHSFVRPSVHPAVQSFMHSLTHSSTHSLMQFKWVHLQLGLALYCRSNTLGAGACSGMFCSKASLSSSTSHSLMLSTSMLKCPLAPT